MFVYTNKKCVWVGGGDSEVKWVKGEQERRLDNCKLVAPLGMV